MIIASYTMFDSRGLVFGVKLSDENISDIEALRNVAMATVFRTTLAVHGL